MGDLKKKGSSIEESYTKIITRLKSHSVDEKSLIQIKSKFQQEIDSPRRYQILSSLAELIDLLERQLLIHSHNIGLINKIIQVCENKVLIDLLIEHHKLLTDHNYSSEPVDYKDNSRNHDQVISGHNIPSSVIGFISERIGDSWKEMAHELEFKEGEIDLIDENLENSVKKSQEILRAYSNKSLCCTRGRLLHALTNIRRKRLKEEVEHMMMRSCINCRLPSTDT